MPANDMPVLPVLVTVTLDAHERSLTAEQIAKRLNVSGFEVDPNYAPVPLDSDINKTTFEVVISGLASPGAIAQLRTKKGVAVFSNGRLETQQDLDGSDGPGFGTFGPPSIDF